MEKMNRFKYTHWFALTIQTNLNRLPDSKPDRNFRWLVLAHPHHKRDLNKHNIHVIQIITDINIY